MTETLARGTPGMRSVHDMKVVQDGPPPGACARLRGTPTTPQCLSCASPHPAAPLLPGGFPSVRFGRRIPNTGPTGTALFGVSTLVIAYGFYKVRTLLSLGLPTAPADALLTRGAPTTCLLLSRWGRATTSDGAWSVAHTALRSAPAHSRSPRLLRRALKQEKMAARKAIAPVLQAEEDRRYAVAAQEARKAEAMVMKNVPGWVPGQSQYNGGRWTPPALSLRPNPATS